MQTVDLAQAFSSNLFHAEPLRCSVSIRQFSPVLALKMMRLTFFRLSTANWQSALDCYKGSYSMKYDKCLYFFCMFFSALVLVLDFYIHFVFCISLLNFLQLKTCRFLSTLSYTKVSSLPSSFPFIPYLNHLNIFNPFFYEGVNRKVKRIKNFGKEHLAYNSIV